MKDSGIEWIGEMPDDWSCAKLSYYIDIFTGNSISDSEKKQFEIFEGIPYIATKDINVDFASVEYDNGMRVPVDSNFKIAKCGSVLLCIEGGSAGKKIAFIDRDVAFVNKLCAFKARDGFTDKYLYYFIFSDAFIAPFNLSMTGLIGGVSQAAIKGIKILIPTKNEQQKIANLLDDKCAKIDNLISHEQAMIEELKAYKQSVITEAVTKGLDKSAPMKDSGVEWIGKIPESWSISKIKMLADETQENAFIDGDWIESPYIEDTGIRYLTTGNIGDGVFKRQGNGFISNETFTKLQCKYAYPQDLIFSRLNEEYGRSCILPNDYDKYVIAVDNVILRTNEDKKYICYVTQCSNYHKTVFFYARGTAMKRISRTNLGNVAIPLPPIDEQQHIADYLDEKCADIDSLISIKQQKIEELKEYKKSLIYEYVTGKKEVA